MNIQDVLKRLDSLFEQKRYYDVEAFLNKMIEQAKEEQDDNSYITLLNERIGFYRDASMYDKSVSSCHEVYDFMTEKNMDNSIEFATTLLNIANAYRAAGKHKESFDIYGQVEGVYNSRLEKNDFRFASLYNNLSLLHQEVKDYEGACDCLRKALAIVETYEDARIELATTHTNLAASLLHCEKAGALNEAFEHLKTAKELYSKDEPKNFHYGACLSAYADAYYQTGDFKAAIECLEEALAEIESNIGKNQSYYICRENLEKIYRESEPLENFKGLKLSGDFYSEYGKTVFEGYLEKYEDKISIAVVGEGSERFGFDDEYSTDHDFGAGFMVVVDDDVYDEIADELEEKYSELPELYKGIFALTRPVRGVKRSGVFKTSDFYNMYLGNDFYNKWKTGKLRPEDMLAVEEYQLATVTNGVILDGGVSDFIKIRRELKYYSRPVWYRKIAYSLAAFSQYGQYNYNRMLKRNDKVTAFVALSKAAEEAMNLVYLCNRIYSPYYKWKKTGLNRIYVLKDVVEEIEKITEYTVGNPKINEIMDFIAPRILEYLQDIGLVKSYSFTKDVFMERYVDEVSACSEEWLEKEELVEEIVKLEWEAFDKVKNEGGRASCQNDWFTFSIMRKSQYFTWPVELLNSYKKDFEAANKKGRNLITEKYGRMMESTAPEEYEKIKDYFPQISEERKQIQETIISIQVSWMENFAKDNKKLAGKARIIHTFDDQSYDTSYETYLRGEISTYSEETIEMYGRFIVNMYREGRNLAKDIMFNTILYYGYNSLEHIRNA